LRRTIVEKEEWRNKINTKNQQTRPKKNQNNTITNKQKKEKD
jgi:hypothetical protein